jgi:gentisate 1,2-dioxygenase
MKVLDFRPEKSRLVKRYGSRFRIVSSQIVVGRLTVSCMYLDPGGHVGRHRTTTRQLFMIVKGQGWVRTGKGNRRPMRSGEGVSWKTGEWHEAGSDEGMTVVVVEYTSP